MYKLTPANERRWTNAALKLAQRRRRWANFETTLTQCILFVPHVQPKQTNSVLLLGRSRRRGANIQLTLAQYNNIVSLILTSTSYTLSKQIFTWNIASANFTQTRNIVTINEFTNTIQWSNVWPSVQTMIQHWGNISLTLSKLQRPQLYIGLHFYLT